MPPLVSDMDVDDDSVLVGNNAMALEEHTIRSPLRDSPAVMDHETQVSITAAAKKTTKPASDAQLFRIPLQIVTIRVKGKEFRVHKELLVKDSFYFHKALNGGFVEAETQEIDFDDILPADFGWYIDLVYRSFFVPNFILRKEQVGGSLSTRQLLALWQLSDRFLNTKLVALVKESLQHRLSLYSPAAWVRIYAKQSKEDIVARIGRLQDAYHLCKDGSMPFDEDIAQAAANCPGAVYLDTVHIMESDFMAAVSKRMIASLSRDLREPTADPYSRPGQYRGDGRQD